MADTTFTFKLKRDRDDNVVQLNVAHQPLADFLLELLPKQDEVYDLKVTKTETIELLSDG